VSRNTARRRRDCHFSAVKPSGGFTNCPSSLRPSFGNIPKLHYKPIDTRLWRNAVRVIAAERHNSAAAAAAAAVEEIMRRNILEFASAANTAGKRCRLCRGDDLETHGYRLDEFHFVRKSVPGMRSVPYGSCTLFQFEFYTTLSAVHTKQKPCHAFLKMTVPKYFRTISAPSRFFP